MKKLYVIMIIALIFTLGFTVKPAAACDCQGVGTPGYWKNHPEAWTQVWIGGEYWSQDKVMPWLMKPVRTDKTISMFKALVAAQLNYVDASCACDEIGSWISEAQGWIYWHPVGSGVRANSAAWRAGEKIFNMLDAYNNGLVCYPHRD